MALQAGRRGIHIDRHGERFIDGLHGLLPRRAHQRHPATFSAAVAA